MDDGFVIDEELADDLILSVAFALFENGIEQSAENVTVHLLRALYLRNSSWDELHERAAEIYERAEKMLR
jgi:hypothetical protein